MTRQWTPNLGAHRFPIILPHHLLEGPCFSTQILVDTSKFLVKYGLFNHAYIYICDMINYGEIWTDLAQDGALFVAIHHFLYVTPWSTAGGRWSAATLMSFLAMNEPKYQGISQTTCWRILSLLKTWMSIKLCVYTWLDFPPFNLHIINVYFNMCTHIPASTTMC